MLKRINDVLAGVWMTLVSGVFLAASLALQLTGTALPIDPAWGSAVISGLPLVYLALWRVVHNPGISKISSALLISVAMIAAIAIGDIFAAGEVAFIMAIGAILEEKTTERAQRGLKALISLSPQQGRRLRDGKEELVPVSQIEKGDLLRVLPGETIPVDGVVVSGSSSVDQAVLTGESLPADKEAGDPVFCGTINRFGAMELRAEKVGEDASLQKLIRMVREAEENKAPMQRLADRWASWLVPAALLIAVAAYFATGELVRAVTVLVVFCPCALVLATPTAIMAAIGQATKHGVIIKSGEALERMGKADVVAFDKTGTLTYGRLQVVAVRRASDAYRESEVYALAAAAEQLSEHPLGKAVVRSFRQSSAAQPAGAADFKMVPGRGVEATVSGTAVSKSFVVNEAPAEVTLTPTSANGKISGKIFDADTNQSISGASILIKQGDMVIASCTSNQSGSYEAVLPDGVYRIEITKSGYIPFVIYETIEDGRTTYLESAMMIQGNSQLMGGFSGQITDAVTGAPVSGVSLTVRSGWNNSGDGDVMATLTTDGNGRFESGIINVFGVIFGLPSGNYTVTASKPGYVTTSFNVVVLPGVVTSGQDGTISPEMETTDGEYRVVLTWGQTPSDLDSHYNAITAFVNKERPVFEGK